VIAGSAGVEESAIQPLTIEVMKEVGINILDQQSKHIDMKAFISSQWLLSFANK
jgi:protein-tyrosine-phosphatase